MITANFHKTLLIMKELEKKIFFNTNQLIQMIKKQALF